METKHAPGPWKANEDEGNGLQETELANARLRAAAPNLLAACEHARAALPDITFAESPEQRAVIEQLNEAIDYATK